MTSTFKLSQRELFVLITEMQHMTYQQVPHYVESKQVSDLYNKLHSRHEHLERLHHDYIHDI